mgnify:CR=1 FL=1
MKEKSQIEKNAEERQIELLSTALNEASNAGGHWLNAAGKGFPKFYPRGVAVSPFNGLFMALHSDRNGCKTNLFTLYSDAKARGTSVREHEQGVPFLFYNWNKYVHRNNPEDIISRDAYLKLDEEVQKQYKGIHNREIRTLFNIDQTTLPYVDKEEYDMVLLKDGSAVERGYSEADERRLHIRFNDFLLKMRDNLVPVRSDGSGMPHYETDRDAVYMPRQRDFGHYNDYVQEALRQIVSATGHQQRLAREGMVMKNGVAPSEDATKQERLVVEVASAIKMMELGLPGKLSNESMPMVDYWNRELKENPCLIDALESDVNNALEVIKRAELGQKVEYSSMRNQAQTTKMQEQMPKHYFVADEIKQHPSKENRMVVLVRDEAKKTADVILPAGASLEVNNEVPGMSKDRIKRALEQAGFENVNFYNPDGALGYRPDDSYFAGKGITVSRLRNWELEDVSKLDVTEAVAQSKQVGFDRIQMLQDDNKRWAMYIKPEGQQAFSIYPDKADLNRFFSTLKQAQDTLDSLRVELAQKYYAMAAMKPDLKVDLFGHQTQDLDINRIQKVNVFKTKEDVILCAATIDGVPDLKPRAVSPSQWQRMWLAEDKNDYKTHLAATLFADVLKKGQSLEENANEKQDKETEQKQGESAVVKQSEETKKEVKAEEEEKPREETKAEPSLILKQYLDLKKKHPDAVLLFRCGDFYETYMQDAEKASRILGITLTKSSKTKDPEGKPLAMAGFPYHALDSYLPKLIRAGERVAICDQLAPRQEQQKSQSEQREQETQQSHMKR